MKDDLIAVQCDGDTVTECTSAIVVPERAMDEAGDVKTLTMSSTAHSKHELHAIAEIALSLFQEGELGVDAVFGPLTIQWKSETQTVAAGLVVLRDAQGEIHLVGNTRNSVEKLLQSAHRFCTRWVRLDI